MVYTEKFKKEQKRSLVTQTGDTIYFGCGPLNAMKAIKVQMKLQRILGPAVVALAAGGTDIEALLKDERVTFNLLKSLEDMDTHEAEVMSMVAEFCQKTQFSYDGDNWKTLGVPGSSGLNSFDEVFCGMLDIFYKWLFFHLELNFKDFIESLKSVASEKGQGETPQKAAE